MPSPFDPRDPNFWQWGGPPPSMSPGVGILRSGSVGGSITSTNISVPAQGGNMLVQQIRNGGREISHYTSHPGGPAHTRKP